MFPNYEIVLKATVPLLFQGISSLFHQRDRINLKPPCIGLLCMYCKDWGTADRNNAINAKWNKVFSCFATNLLVESHQYSSKLFQQLTAFLFLTETFQMWNCSYAKYCKPWVFWSLSVLQKISKIHWWEILIKELSLIKNIWLILQEFYAKIHQSAEWKIGWDTAVEK